MGWKSTIDITREQAIDMIVKAISRKPYEEMYNACERDNFLSAQAALEFGLIDQIIGKREEHKVEAFSGGLKH